MPQSRARDLPNFSTSAKDSAASLGRGMSCGAESDEVYFAHEIASMNATYHPGVYKFSVFVVLWTVFLFVAGALVTSNNAALSVPDWPLSFHTYFPKMTGGVFYEHGHRMIAGVLAVLTLVQAILVWVKEERRWLRWFAGIAVGGVLVQAVLGGEVVMQLLRYWLPVAHACFGQIVFAASLSIAVFTSKWWVSERPQMEDTGSPSMHSVAIVNAAVIYLQVIFGAGFRHSYLPMWPHMAGALLVLGVVIWTAVLLRKRFGTSAELTKARVLLHAIVGTQILLGLAAYWARITTPDGPPTPGLVWSTVIHTVFGAMLFAFSVLIVLLCYRIIPAKGARKEELSTSQVVGKGPVAVG
jgi:cytochrome c oxidase assembly protein subunit 15